MKFFTKTELRIFLIFWIIFSVFATSDRWNDNSSLDLTMAIVDEHRFEIDSYANNTGDRTYYQGHYYSDKVPGTAFLAVPLYQIYKILVREIPYKNDESALYEANLSWEYQLFLFLSISLISAVCGALTVVLVYKISRYFTSNDLHRNLIIIVLGLGTLLPHAGRQFNSHAISTFFIFLCFYLIFKMKKEKTDYSFPAGMAGGFAVLTEYRTIIILFGLFVMVLTLRKWKLILKFIMGVSILYSILLLYSYNVYDSPFANPHQYTQDQLWRSSLQPILCNKVPYEEIHKSKNLPTFIIHRFSSIGKHLQSQCIKSMRLLFDPFKGLVFYSPIMLFSFIGLFLMYRRYKTETLVIFFCFLVYIYHFSSMIMWWMGLSFGPRHLTALIPFLMIPLLYAFKKISIKIILFFTIFSVIINVIGLQSVDLSNDPILFSNNYCEKMKSYLPLTNPLFNNYIPSLLASPFQHPQARQLVLEYLLNFRIIPFTNIVILLFSFILIWKNDTFFKNGK